MSTYFTCRICGSNAHRRTLTVREMMFGTREEFAYDECDGCDGLQIREIPSDLSRFYPANYYSFAQGGESLSRKRRIVLALRRTQRRAREVGLRVVADLIERRFGPLDDPELLREHRPRAMDRILDVGCGAGVLLRELRDAGFSRLQGVDPYIPAPLSFSGGVTIAKAQLNELQGQFDLIMLHHVFEHLPDPLQTLRDARRLLAPTGMLLLRFPSSPCEALDIYGADWVQLDAPRHLHIVSRAGLARLAVKADLQLVSWAQDSGPLQFWGSEQYQLDIPLFDARSYAQDSRAIPEARYRELEARAATLNAAGRGDQSVAVLAAATSALSQARTHVDDDRIRG